MQAVTITLGEIIEQITAVLRWLLADASDFRASPVELGSLSKALSEVDIYLDKVVTSPKQGQVHQQHISALHVSDHLKRILHRCQDTESVEVIRGDDELMALARKLVISADQIRDWLNEVREPTPIDSLHENWRSAVECAGPYREHICVRVASDDIGHEDANRRLDGIRWLRRVLYHLWRTSRRMNVLRKGVFTTIERKTTLRDTERQ